MAPAFYERRIEYIELSGEKAYEYLNFVVKALHNVYSDRIKFVLKSTYEDKPAASITISTKSGDIDVLLVADRNPWYRILTLKGERLFERVNLIAQIIEGATLLFSETEGKGIVYFAFVPRMRIVPPKYESLTYKLFGKLLFGNLVFALALSLVIFYIFWTIFKSWAPVALILSQIPLLIIAYKIIEFSLGDWVLDPTNRHVYLVGIKLPLEEYSTLLTRFFYPHRFEFKRRIYEETIRVGREPTKDYVKSLLEEYGFSVDYDSIVVKRVDLYSIVERVFRKFGIPIPRVIVSNIVIPNAAATGVLRGLSGLLVTTGLLTRLDEEEVEAVIAHEASHVKHRDPFLLFILISAEYLTRVSIALTFWHIFVSIPFLEFLYLLFSLTLLFFAAKFIEARADIEAALLTGKPSKLANALKKIGTRRLLRERGLNARLSAWLLWDNHPPITFRIETLEKMKAPPVENPWKLAIKGCLKDFLNCLLKAA